MLHSRSLALLVGCASLAFTTGTSAQTFTFLEAGFTQELWGTHDGFLGGVAFAPDGDVLANGCQGYLGPLFRWDSQSTIVVNGTAIHPELASMPSDVGCGMVNHPDGGLYSNTLQGVKRIDPDTGLLLGAGSLEVGNVLSIAVDPQTGDLWWIRSGLQIRRTPPDLSPGADYSTALVGIFDLIDGMYFDPSGDYLFIATRGPSTLTVFHRSLGVEQQIPMVSPPDGVAVHEQAGFVLTTNVDGTISKFTFPSNDYSLPPVETVFASGGFRSDLSQVGADGYLYLTQEGTRYDDGTVTTENSIVRIGPGFVRPPGVCWNRYGTAAADLLGQVPRLSLDGCMKIGETTDIVTSGLTGIGCLLIGFEAVDVPAFHGTILVNPAIGISHPIFPPTLDRVSFEMPLDPDLVDLPLFMQEFAIAQTLLGLNDIAVVSFSRGLRTVIQP
ncbi:MAG: hypothetical protein KDB80_12005 [Planctomycetes bacterium]|nr:hypothetical protein [Planctomycetota bacterium]